MGKRILILGNGFDLAHGLPTRYSDFLEFCRVILDTFKSFGTFIEECASNSIVSTFQILFIDSCKKKFKIKENQLPSLDVDYFYLKKTHERINQNSWYVYLNDLYNHNVVKGENWIDFESEICTIVELIDKTSENLLYEFEIPQYPCEDTLYQNDRLMLFLTKFVRVKNLYYEDEKEPTKIKIKDLRKELYNDLKNLIKALAVYLSLVDSISTNLKSKDITDCYDYIINFNYTHTYQKYYGDYAETFHIHGEVHEKTNEESKEELNNMVLGIDEYWDENEQNAHTNFTVFKKFAQRIMKKTGIKCYNWFDEIWYDYEKHGEIAEVFIFGHSLDITDKDILSGYLKSAATKVTIYCKDKETEGDYIANIIKMIGEKRLLEKVNQDPPKLKFETQKTMKRIKSIKEKELLPAVTAT